MKKITVDILLCTAFLPIILKDAGCLLNPKINMWFYNFELKRILAIINSSLLFHKSVNGSIRKLSDFTKWQWLVNIRMQIRTAHPLLGQLFCEVWTMHRLPTDSSLSMPETDKKKPRGFYEFPPQKEWDSHPVCIRLYGEEGGCWEVNLIPRMSIQVHPRSVHPSHPESFLNIEWWVLPAMFLIRFVIWEWGQRLCTANKFPGDATATSHSGHPDFENYWPISPSSEGWLVYRLFVLVLVFTPFSNTPGTCFSVALPDQLKLWFTLLGIASC